MRRDGDRFAADAVLLVGAGEKAELTPNAIRRVLGRAAGTLGRFGTAATTFPQAVGARELAAAIRASVEGLVLGAYRFDRYKAAKGEKALTRVTVLGSARGDAKAARDAVRRGHVVADAVCWARDLVNTPAGDLPPAQIAREAQKMAREVGLRCKVWGKPELEKGGLRRDPRRRRRQREPTAADRALVQGRGHARRPSRSRARGSRSTPAVCPSRTPRVWRR